jgi:hypothetical protein
VPREDSSTSINGSTELHDDVLKRITMLDAAAETKRV